MREAVVVDGVNGVSSRQFQLHSRFLICMDVNCSMDMPLDSAIVAAICIKLIWGKN